MALTVRVLILTSELDFATDKVCLELARIEIGFLRLNRETLSDCRICLDPAIPIMLIDHDDERYEVGAALQSVWWRQGTFDRNLGSRERTLDEQCAHSQWGAFMRSMMVFDHACWINHPAATYRAEVKAVQLKEAGRVGFAVPETRMTNDPSAPIASHIGNRVALKSIDTLLLREGAEQLFGYTTLLPWAEISCPEFQVAPATVQAALEPKLDLRVTIIGQTLWCVAIKKHQRGIAGDWRLTQKADLQIEDFDLPQAVKEMCFALLHSLDLSFGAIDLALTKAGYWFIEVNPTGEWGWLDTPDRPIARQIASKLVRAC